MMRKSAMQPLKRISLLLLLVLFSVLFSPALLHADAISARQEVLDTIAYIESEVVTVNRYMENMDNLKSVYDI